MASGHVEVFHDPLVESLITATSVTAQDHLIEAYEAKHGALRRSNGPGRHSRTRTPAPGPVDRTARVQHDAQDLPRPDRDRGGLHYLRPETAQGIFVNFANVVTTSRKKPPFGIGQIGKSFRNEITPGNFIFRTREFEQMEMEFFVEPSTARRNGTSTGSTNACSGTSTSASTATTCGCSSIPRTSCRTTPTAPSTSSTSSASRATRGVNSKGVANRTDFDLSTHSKHSGVDLSFYDQATDTRYVPYVIEPAAGLTRSFMAFLIDAYTEDEAPNAKGGVDKRTVLRLDPRLAPVKAAVLPLSRHADLSPKARDLAAELRKSWNVEFDDAGAIGRRYRRQDEIGTPFCVTLDFESLDDHAVTVRERDAMTQERVAHRRRARLSGRAAQGRLVPRQQTLKALRHAEQFWRMLASARAERKAPRSGRRRAVAAARRAGRAAVGRGPAHAAAAAEATAKPPP